MGIGSDVHLLKKGRPMVLGGLKIEFPRGPQGHSDGDALLHAITDALLGAAGLGDIGEWFPDSDPRYRGADSAKLLGVVRDRVAKRFRIVNVDAIVAAGAPRLGPLKRKIRDRVARLLGVASSRVNIKAKTMAGLGEVGRGRAIEAHAVVELQAR